MKAKRVDPETKAAKPSILVLDDHPIVRHGLVQLLKRSREFDVCGESGATEDLPRLLEARPSLLLIDLFMAGNPATEAISLARKLSPDLGILVISMQNESYYAELAIKAGADGYILKEEATDQILHALRQVGQRKTYLSFSILKRMLHRYGGRGESGKREAVRRLSEREFQVLRLLSEGWSSVRIAEDLGLSVKSVETYRARLKKKLQLRSNAELLRYAVRWNLTPT